MSGDNDTDTDDRAWLETIHPGYAGSSAGEVSQIGERVTGKLRDPKVEAAWRAATNDEWLHDVRLNGLQLPLRDGVWPPRHHSNRNSIKPEYADWAREAVAELVTHGAVSEWTEFCKEGHATSARPHCVMPLIVEPKPGKPGKYRLIHDARYLNEYLIKTKFKLERLQDFVKELRHRDRMFALDLASAYHHVEIHPRFCTLIGFAFEGKDYVYRCLPFGLSVSAYVFCRFSEVTANAIRSSGLTTALVVYVDDFGGSSGPKKDMGRMNEIIALVRSFNWTLAPDKMDLELGWVMRLLGFLLDTDNMVIRVPEDRRRKLRATASAIDPSLPVVARSVCQVVGQVISLQLSLGLVCRLRTRHLIHAVREAARANNYSTKVELGERAAAELAHWQGDLNGMPATPMHAHRREADVKVHCDASDHALAAIVVRSPSDTFTGAKFYRRLRDHEAAWSSALRELTGYHDAVLTLAKRGGMKGLLVEIVGDSQACKYIFENGGSQCVDQVTGELLIADTLSSLLGVAEEHGFEARFRWVRREFVQDADDLSKVVDRMDFSLRPRTLDYVWQRAGGWDIDAFASPTNATVARFYAAFDSTTAEGVDALGQAWSSGVLFILPDFHRISEVLDKVERDNAEVIMLVPEWQQKRWWHRLASGPWQDRIAGGFFLPPDSLVANNDDCFFGSSFTTRLFAFRTRRV